ELEPFMPVKKALVEADLGHLISEKPPPKVLCTYVIDEGGILVAKAEREESELDGDIFASMLSAVENFVKDSLQMMGDDEASGLNSIGYDRFNILLQTFGDISIAVVIDGTPNEFLVDDMKRVLSGIKKEAERWDGDVRKTQSIGSELSWFIDSGKYDGDYLVDEPEIRKENLYDNILMGLQRLSKEKNVIFFLDNLQWADDSSLSLFHYISRNTLSDSIFLIGAYRPENIVSTKEGVTHPLSKTLQYMNRENLYEEISLSRLDDEDIEELIDTIVDTRDLSSDFINRIYENSEGNPFYVIESMKLLRSKGYFEGEEEIKEKIGFTDIPSEIEDVVLNRLSDLSDEDMCILEAASVIGNEFTSDILDELVDVNKLALLRALNKIEKKYQLIHSEGGKYRFDHNMVRETIYNGLTEETRRKYHLSVAEKYAEKYGDDLDEVIEKVAHHYLMSEDERAGKYLLGAAEKSKEKYANEEAKRFYKNALEFVKDEEDLLKVYEGYGEVLSLTGNYQEGISNYKKAIGFTDDNKRKAALYRKISSDHENIGEYEKSLEVCSKSLELLEDENSPEYAKLLNTIGWIEIRRGNYDEATEKFNQAYEVVGESGHKEQRGMLKHSIGTVQYLKGEYDEAIRNLEYAIELNEEQDKIDNVGSSYNNLGLVFWRKGETDRSLESHEKSLEIRKKIGDERGIAMTFDNIGNVYHDMGEMERALEYHKKGLKRRRKIGDERGLSISLNNVGGVYQEMGELEKAIEYHEESLEIKERLGDEQGIASSYNNMGEAYHSRGELDKAKEYHERALDLREKLGNVHGIASSINNLGEVLRDMGDLKSSQKYFNKALVKSVGIGDTNNETISLNNLGGLHLLKGETDRAEQYISKSMNLSSDKGHMRLKPFTKRLIARLRLEEERFDVALKHAKEALDISEEIDSKNEICTSLRLMGEISIRKSQIEEAEDYLKRGLDMAELAGEVIEKSKMIYFLGIVHKEMGQKEDSMRYLEKAMSKFKKIGMPYWVDKCEEEIQ
ncbi:MAG: tetratricopeptide repeat protein, partial [Thermoplasmatota archaeon]